MSHSALVDEWIATNGAPPKFEPGASASFDSHASYLATFGIQLRRMGWRMQLSQNSGPWRNVSLGAVLRLVNTFREIEGREPIRAVRR